MPKLTKQQMDELKDDIEAYKNYRMFNASTLSNIYTALFVAIFLVLIEIFNYSVGVVGIKHPTILVIDILLLFVAFYMVHVALVKRINDTFKPVVVTEKFIATVEREGETKDKKYRYNN